MKKQQVLLIILSLTIATGLYFCGPTVSPDKNNTAQTQQQTKQEPLAHTEQVFNIDDYIAAAIEKIPANRRSYLESLENKTKNGNPKDQQIKALKSAASYWRDSLHNFVAYLHFLEKAATLENSEKSLTFAGHSTLRYLPFADHPEVRVWLASNGRKLFENALRLNIHNDSSIVGLGGCYIYGATDDENNSPMTGINKIREVASRDSNNVFAQYMLGVGGIISGQLDKAVLRFEKVAKAEPSNIEVLFKLAETYEKLGDKSNAVKWYTAILDKSRLPDMRKELEQRINQLKQ